MGKEKTLDEALDEAMSQIEDDSGADDAVVESNADNADTAVSGENKEDSSDEGSVDANVKTEVKKDEKTSLEADKQVSGAKREDAKGSQNAPTFEAPASWRKDEKALWDSVPLPVRAAIARREREAVAALTEANQKLATREKEGGDVDRVLAPYVKQWSERGIRTAEAIAQTMARASYAYQNPQKFIQEFAQENGIDLTTFMDDAQTNVDPAIKQVLDKFNAFEQRFSQQETQRKTNEQTEFSRSVNSFIDEKDAEGNLLRPHFDKVSSMMIPLVDQLRKTEPHSGLNSWLTKAYEMACRAHPDVWQQMKEDMFVQSQQSQVMKQVESSKAAKSRAISPSSSGPAGGALSENMHAKTLDEAIDMAFSQNASRV